MARGVTLSQLVTDLRAEIGASVTATVGLQERAGLVRLLQLTQERLYEQYDWPFLQCFRDKTLNAGQRFYDFPADMSVEHVADVRVKWNGQLIPVEYGIGIEDYNVNDPDQTAASGYFDVTGGSSGGSNVVSAVKVDGFNILGASVAWTTSDAHTATLVAAQINTYNSHPEYTASADGNRVTISAAEAEGAAANDRVITVTVGGAVTAGTPVDLSGGTTCSRVDPVVKWQVNDNGDGPQIEVFPVPSSTGTILRLFGKRDLQTFMADADVCDLDGTLIVAVAAANKRAGQKDGEAKSKIASDLLISLRSNAKKSGSFKMGQSSRERPRYGTVIRIAGT